jgi:hypothetical protein
METEGRITLRLMATLWILVVFLATFPAEAFNVPTKHQVIPMTSSLFSNEEERHDQDPQREKKGQNPQPKLRRYRGGMIQPAATATPAKSDDSSSNFVEVNRHDTNLNKKDGGNRSDAQPTRPNTEASMFRPSGMFQPSVVRTSDKKSATPPPVSMPLEFNGFEVEPKKIEAEAKKTSSEEEIEKTKKIEHRFEILGNIAEAETEQMVGEEREKLKPKAASNESKTEVDTEAKNSIESTDFGVSAIEDEEAKKLTAVQAMVRQREEKQVELDKIEEELLFKTNEIKKSREELVRLKDEFARAEDAIRKNSDKSEEIRSRETSKTVPHYSPKEYNALSKEEKQKLKADRAALKKIRHDNVDIVRGDNSNTSADSNNKSAIHPILGPVIADLGYKRVHVVSSGRLGTIPIWEKQRTYQFDRTKRMAIDKSEQMHLGFLGIICLHEDANRKLSIIDGQHRVGMMQQLRADRKNLKKRQIETEAQGDNERMWKEQEEYFQNVLVEVYSELSTGDATCTANKGQSYAEQIFLEINKAEPIAPNDV